MAIGCVPGCPSKQNNPGESCERWGVDEQPQNECTRQHGADRYRVAERDGDQRKEHDAFAPAVQAKRDRKQPPHGRVEPVEQPQSGNRKPGPQRRLRCAHG